MKFFSKLLLPVLGILVVSFQSCVDSASGHGNLVGYSSSGKTLGSHPTVAQRASDIKNEASGDYYIGRRYLVKKTTLWGYLRKPRHSWNTGRLVVMNESSKLNPDRLPESGVALKHGYDQNFEYKIWGHYTGDNIYEPNSNQFLPEFKLQRYELVSKDPGWLFSPSDRYDPASITLRRN